VLPASEPGTLGEVLPEITKRFAAEGAVGVLLLDACRLGEIEQRYGFDTHERVLRAIGAVVRDVCAPRLRPGDMHVAGDPGRGEYAVLLFRELDQGDFYRSELAPLARRIVQTIERDANRIFYPVPPSRGAVAAGIALAFRNPFHAVVSQIRSALDEARRDARLNEQRATRAEKRRLLNVLLNGQVRSVYEPIVDARTLTVFGYEALARGPEGTSLSSPMALFELAERTQLVFALDCLCRRGALRGAVDFPTGTKLFLNIRPSAFHDPSFQPDALRRTLDACGLGPGDVVFEISEQESIQNFPTFRKARDAYGAIGFQFALDDTGSGYASFQAVMELAPEFVKVDRAFVAGVDEDPARQAILHGFQTIADRIGARIIGEGLDTLEELDTLRALGVPFGQGWLFGKPTPLRAG
jgi:EAL domain-containing protein (putative c-di-GMP-specific phosphodiesterase class I)